MSEAVRSRAPEQLSPYEAVLRSFGYFERVTAEDLAAARSGLELAVRKAPAYADAWAMLALLCVQDYAQGFNLQPDSLASGLTAARRAVGGGAIQSPGPFQPGPGALLPEGIPELPQCGGAGRRPQPHGRQLHRLSRRAADLCGRLRSAACALAGRAKQLNPHHPGWYWYADFYDAYRQGDDRGALGFALKVNLPGHWCAHAVTGRRLRAAREARCGRQGPAGAAQAAAGLRRHCPQVYG